MVAGVILAAGQSSRMGRPKALLTCPDGRTFVRALVEALRAGGVHAPIVVARPDDGPLRSEVDRIDAAGLVVNEEADRGGQLSSLVAGLRQADRPGVRALMVVPVDAPLVTSDTIATLIAVFSATAAPIVRARYQGRHGHPVIFSRALFDELRAADPQAGAKAVLRAHATAIVNVDVDDPAVVGDVDTPDDYHRLLGNVPLRPPEA
jgi:molybdenum cofactor cytidylyltransferase